MIPVSTATLVTRPAIRPKLDTRPNPAMSIALVVFLVAGPVVCLPPIASSFRHREHGCRPVSRAGTVYAPLGFEFVNGILTTPPTPVATVIYHGLRAFQGASAEVVAMATIGAADSYGLPVSTTQVLSSGVAGTMAANGSGLQWGTVRNPLLAWVLTLPAAIVLSGFLYVLLRQVF